MNDFIYPEITPHAKCPTCGELVFINIDKYANENGEPIWENIEEKYERCLNCGIEIEVERELFPSLEKNFTLTSAISSGNSLITFDFAIFSSSEQY